VVVAAHRAVPRLAVGHELGGAPQGRAAPLAERDPVRVGAVAGALFPLLYVGFAPLALLLLLS
jgi:hypothetical protein